MGNCCKREHLVPKESELELGIDLERHLSRLSLTSTPQQVELGVFSQTSSSHEREQFVLHAHPQEAIVPSPFVRRIVENREC